MGRLRLLECDEAKEDKAEYREHISTPLPMSSLASRDSRDLPQDPGWRKWTFPRLKRHHLVGFWWTIHRSKLKAFLLCSSDKIRIYNVYINGGLKVLLRICELVNHLLLSVYGNLQTWQHHERCHLPWNRNRKRQCMSVPLFTLECIPATRKEVSYLPMPWIFRFILKWNYIFHSYK